MQDSFTPPPASETAPTDLSQRAPRWLLWYPLMCRMQPGGFWWSIDEFSTFPRFPSCGYWSLENGSGARYDRHH